MTNIRIHHISAEYDRRRKLHPNDTEQILEYRAKGESYQRIAMRYGVSNSLIRYICNPDAAKRNVKQLYQRIADGKQYITKEKRKEVWDRHIAYKKQLIEQGKI